MKEVVEPVDIRLSSSDYFKLIQPTGKEIGTNSDSHVAHPKPLWRNAEDGSNYARTHHHTPAEVA